MSHPDALPLLAIVIPVWNDDGLARLLRQLLPLPGIGQIIIVDDASDLPCSPESLGLPAAVGDPRILWLRNDSRRGAGHARNIGLTAVTCPWTLFFDSDDLLTPGFTALLDDLAARPATAPDFDFCLFRHVDSRVRAAGGYAPLAGDQRYWAEIAAPETPTPVTQAQAARIVRIAAYPWNKIYRTAFLREQGIRCTEIPVHNDVELHWTSFFRAQSILVSSRICCEHFVHEAGQRLTNRSGRERFAVFEALQAMQADLQRRPDRMITYAEPAVEFYLRLFDWIDETLEPDLRAPFRAEARGFLCRVLSPALFTLIATSSLPLARRINSLLSERPA